MESYLKTSHILYKFIHNIYYRERDNFINNTFVFNFNYIQHNGAWEYMPSASKHHLVIVEHKSNWKIK